MSKRLLNQEKRNAILEAASVEFEANGYLGANVSMIAAKANVAKATVYKHFTSKQILFLSLLYEYRDRFQNIHNFKYYSNHSVQQQLKNYATEKILFFSHQSNMRISRILQSALLTNSNISEEVRNGILNVYDYANLQLVNFFNDAQLDQKIHFDDVNIVIHMFDGHLKALSFYPQLYGASPLSLDEVDKVVETSVKLIESLYIK